MNPRFVEFCLRRARDRLDDKGRPTVPPEDWMGFDRSLIMQWMLNKVLKKEPEFEPSKCGHIEEKFYDMFILDTDECVLNDHPL